MKMLMIALSLVSLNAFAAYDQTYYRANFWSGEYPNGFSVVKENVTVPAYTQMDANASGFQCAVPFKANYHQWNQARVAEFVSMNKIVPMTAKRDAYIEEDSGKKVKVRKGEQVEYLVYGSEGWFTVRYKGKEYTADRDFLKRMIYDKSLMEIPADEWVKIDCVTVGAPVQGWVLMRQLFKEDSQTGYIDGLASWYLGYRDYGRVEDLTDEDLKK